MDNKKLIENWTELSNCKSETHYLEIDLYYGNGWIIDKETEDFVCYLSTHTFYGSTYNYSTKALQEYGFNVQLKNWDE